MAQFFSALFWSKAETVTMATEWQLEFGNERKSLTVQGCSDGFLNETTFEMEHRFSTTNPNFDKKQIML